MKKIRKFKIETRLDGNTDSNLILSMEFSGEKDTGFPTYRQNFFMSRDPFAPMEYGDIKGTVLSALEALKRKLEEE